MVKPVRSPKNFNFFLKTYVLSPISHLGSASVFKGEIKLLKIKEKSNHKSEKLDETYGAWLI